jgi:hypothetical protein
MQRDFIVVEEEDEYGEIILSLGAIEVRRQQQCSRVFWGGGLQQPSTAIGGCRGSGKTQRICKQLQQPGCQCRCADCRPLALLPCALPHHAQAEVFWARIKQMHANNVPVFVTVIAATRGGFVVQYEHLEGFIPISHLGQVS